MNNEWYKRPEEEVLKLLDSSLEGLSSEEAKNRLEKFGKNQLLIKKPVSVLKIISNQFKNPLIYILVLTSIVSFLLGDIKNSFFIFVVIFLNTSIGAYQEWKAEKSSESLHKLLRIKTYAKRDGAKTCVMADNLVPGDIVFLESGNKVPADIRILKKTNLLIDESLLTGESVEVTKITDVIKRDVPLSDRENMAYAGTIITTGRGIGIITETGLNTELGKISKAVSSFKTLKSPLIQRMENFSRQISILVLFASAIIAFIEFLRGATSIDVFFLAVALAVSAIPEGLPTALTIALSVGMARMAKKNVIIRKLHAVEGLGSCTLIASDKTGTLTLNRQTAKILYLPDGSRYRITGEGYSGEGQLLSCKNKFKFKGVQELVKNAVICNEAGLTKKEGKWISHGDAVDIALLAMGYKYGINPHEIEKHIEILKEIPFEPERRFSAKFYRHKSDDKVFISTKGAFEVILNFCSEINRKQAEKQAKALSSVGYRIIAAAEGEIISKHNHEYYEDDIKNLKFLGLIGLIDPLRPEASDAIAKCNQAGVKVIMITGDNPATAFTIGKTLGIASRNDQVIEGQILEKTDKDSDNYVELINQKTIFARVTPLQKLHIVEALVKSGNYVAVTGDGVNDAPALKKAHISVAMGSGTDVAKDVSSIIVLDDNFASVVAGIEEGRYVYDNIRKVIYLLVATGVSEIVLFSLAIAFNTPIPLTPVQLLWLNLVTNGIQGVGLAFEKGEKETMQKPPRNPKEGIFNELLVKEIAISGISIGVITFVLWIGLILNSTSLFSARNIVLLLMVLFENIQVFNCRSEHQSAFKIPVKNNILLVGGVVVAQIVHIISMNIPVMRDILDIEPIYAGEWLYLLGLSLSALLIMEIFKFFKRQKKDY